MRCYQGDAAGYAALGQRDAALRGAGQAGGDAVHQFDLDPACRQPFGFFATAAEDARIATLEAHHALALAGVTQHQTVDEGLRRGAAAAALAHGDDACVGAVFEHGGVNEIIDHHHLRFTQRAHGLEGQQFRIARAGAYQPDFCAHGEILVLVGIRKVRVPAGWPADA